MKRDRARRWLRPAVIVVIAMLAIAACGDSGGGSSYKEPKGPAQSTLTIKGGNFFFDPKEPQVAAGIVAIKLESTEGLHTLVFDNGKLPGFKLEASSGKSAQLKADLKPGKYTFYCDIPGHREAGMEGTLTVT